LSILKSLDESRNLTDDEISRVKESYSKLIPQTLTSSKKLFPPFVGR